MEFTTITKEKKNGFRKWTTVYVYWPILRPKVLNGGVVRTKYAQQKYLFKMEILLKDMVCTNILY